MIETDAGSLFNTAVVVQGGQLIGSYRKRHLLPGERIFSPGTSCPVFQAGGLKFGINICFDTQFPEAAAAVAAQGAKLIVCPANNMMRRKNAEKWKHRHNEIRVCRAKEAGLWLISSDVTGIRGDSVALCYQSKWVRCGPGPLDGSGDGSSENFKLTHYQPFR